jgi:hypothetical protein
VFRKKLPIRPISRRSLLASPDRRTPKAANSGDEHPLDEHPLVPVGGLVFGEKSRCPVPTEHEIDDLATPPSGEAGPSWRVARLTKAARQRWPVATDQRR